MLADYLEGAYRITTTTTTTTIIIITLNGLTLAE
jgi:hypothetical protein